MLRAEQRRQAQLAAGGETLDGVNQSGAGRSGIRNQPGAQTAVRAQSAFEETIEAAARACQTTIIQR